MQDRMKMGDGFAMKLESDIKDGETICEHGRRFFECDICHEPACELCGATKDVEKKDGRWLCDRHEQAEEQERR